MVLVYFSDEQENVDLLRTYMTIFMSCLYFAVLEDMFLDVLFPVDNGG